jgi:hypothetical protein
MNNVKKMLSKASMILRDFEEVEKSTGEKFNLFSILNRERKEVTTHSRFLAELLSPSGSHGQGYDYLRFFIEMLDNENLKDFDYKSATVKAELNIGNEKDNNAKKLIYWGQIDTFIKDKNGNCIVIENKIDAGDQREQLLRYYDYLNCSKNRFKTKSLYYLTPEGKAPELKSLSNIDGRSLTIDDFKIISFKNFITAWLEKCLNHSNSIPNLRETINQYLRIVKKITKQLDSKLMQEINKNIKRDLKGADAIVKSYDAALKEVSDSLKMDVADNLKLIYPEANIYITNDQPNKRQKDEFFSSIHINNFPIINKDGSVFNGLTIIESFNTKGRFYLGALFIGKFSEKNPKYYHDEKIIKTQDELLNVLDKYGRDEDKDNLLKEVVNEIVSYFDEYKI